MPHPNGVGIALVTVSSVFALGAWIFVGLRTLIRLRMHAFRIDDLLMLLGLLPFTPMCFAATWLAEHRIDKNDPVDVNDETISSGSKWFVVLQLCYAIACAPIKSSICAFLLRFTTARPTIRRVIYCLITIAVIASLITAVAVLTQALPRPLASLWEPGQHGPELRIHWFSYFIAIVSIVLDVTIGTLPIPIIWDLQISRKKKFGLLCILAMASLSSLSTIAGLGLVIRYRNQEGLAGRDQMGLAMVIELGIAVFATSIGSLKPLFQNCNVICRTGTGRSRRTDNSHQMLPLGNLDRGVGPSTTRPLTGILVQTEISISRSPSDERVSTAITHENTVTATYGTPRRSRD